MIHAAAAVDPILWECSYNLFRNNQRPSLVCAVPEDRSVPSFIDADGWSFERAPPAKMSHHPVSTTEPLARACGTTASTCFKP
jgi:hypothetical protein